MIRPNVVLVLAVSIMGCGRDKGVAKTDDSPENQAILSKLQGYIECLRDHSSQVFEVADLYTKRTAGKPPDADHRVPLFATSDPQRCLEAVGDARDLEPALPELVAAGDEFVTAIQAVFDLTTQGQRAFDRADSNDLANRVALHSKLVSAFAAFDNAQGRLFDEVYRVNRAVHADQLARREQRDGRTFAVVADRLRFQAESLVRFAAIRWDQLDRIDLPAFQKQLEAFDYLFDELRSAVAADPKQGGDFKWLLKLARQYQTAGRQLWQRARTKVEFSGAERLMIAADNESAVVGTPAAMRDAYNMLVTWE